jgi:hypothetical protein
MSGMREARWLKSKQVKVGDRLMQYKFSTGETFRVDTGPSGSPAGAVLAVYEENLTGSAYYSNTGEFQSSDESTLEWLVVRDCWDETPAPTAADSPWNGKCRACGRGTYTGFTQVEHEGGKCA